MSNIAFIDGQNLHLGTKENGWKIDLNRFRIYLKDKYKVSTAYYFLGCSFEEQIDLYNNLQKVGFLVLLKEHSKNQLSKKKGNVDADIVFEMMRNLVENIEYNKMILVSGDGDYKKIVEYLISKDKFEKILFPNQKFASSLYYNLGNNFFDYLDKDGIRENIEYKMKKVP
jgi:uncharacterized LabA/DUF88 family protein